jgi:hypothetical protein
MSSAIQNVYFKRPVGGDPGFVVYCGNEKDPIQDCLVYVRVSDDLVLRYQYHSELLPQWQEIHDKVSRLIQSFIVKGD